MLYFTDITLNLFIVLISVNRYSLRRGSSFTFLTPGPHWDFTLVSRCLGSYFKTLDRIFPGLSSNMVYSPVVCISLNIFSSLIYFFPANKLKEISIKYKMCFRKKHSSLTLWILSLISTSVKVKRMSWNVKLFLLHTLAAFLLVEKY